MSTSITPPDEIGKLYDEASRLSGIFNDGQEHLGYWYHYQEEASVAEAGHRVTRKVVDALGLRRGEHVLDAGCGVGAPGVLVARETGARVTGITISAAEVVEAERRVHAAGLVGRVRFERGDYQSIAYSDGSFDAVMAIESLLHVPDLSQVLGEFFRVLRPGGRLGLAECTRETGQHADSTAQIPEQFKSNLLLTVPQWLSALEAAGFAVEEYTQCGPRVYGMGMRYLDHANELDEILVADFGEETVAALKQGYRDMFGAGPRTLGYVILAARKPAIADEAA
ncbi:MAG TPA: methyltransferase domain-containing protein [Streptosporangiaceae bacterium]|nr:methyltransferase domain-containing protein [Streptosporangiaceae bacterium]